MSKLYERFILNYYIQENLEIKASASQIDWQIDEGLDFLLPKMQTDVILKYENKILIIDVSSIHTIVCKIMEKICRTGNLYQIFAHIKNKQIEMQEKVMEISETLLYVGTSESIRLDSDYG